MSFQTPRCSQRAALSAFLTISAVLGGEAAAQGPFQPGMRWIDGASLQTPWIPTTVKFAAADNLVWVGASVGNDRLLCYDAPGSGVAAPALADLTLGLGVDVVDVAAGRDPAQLFALTQRNAPDVFQRVTEVSRRDLLQASAGSTFSAVWTHDLGFAANGPARFEVDEAGSTVVVAAWNDASSYVRLDRVHGATGALLARVDLPSAGLDELVISQDAERTALIMGQRVVVLAAGGSVLHDQTFADGPASLAFDGSGTRLVVGAVGVVRVLEWNGASYVEVANKLGPVNEVASHVGISAHGETWAATWWRFASRDLLRYEVYDGAQHTLLINDSQPGLANGLQNSPVGVKLSRDGERIAVASWGKGDNDPEVVLYDKSSGGSVMNIDLPGSVMDFDLDAAGTRIVVVTKNLHANLFSSTGEVRLYDTGERDLSLIAAPRLGATLHAASRKSGANMSLFLFGERAAAPSTIPGAIGELSLLRSPRLYVFARSADQAGEAQLALQIPSTVALIGMNYALQVAHRVNGQIVFSETTQDVLFH